MDVEFPSVPINPTMEIVDEYNNPYEETAFIFDCIGTDKLILRITPSILKDKWKVSITDENNEMCYFELTPDEYTSQYSSASNENEQGKDIPIVLTDYAVDGGLDIRTVNIELVALEDDGQEKLETKQFMTIQQYNAIIVPVYEDNEFKGKRGFSRFDWGVQRNSLTGEIIERKEMPWGYFQTPTTSVYYVIGDHDNYNGLSNYKSAKRKRDTTSSDNLQAAFDGSAINAAHQPSLYIQEISEDLDWYLPARYEMSHFFQQIASNAEVYNIKSKSNYWTSSGVNDTGSWTGGKYIYYSYAYSLSSSVYEEIEVLRTESCYMRQCCNISNSTSK